MDTGSAGVPPAKTALHAPVAPPSCRGWHSRGYLPHFDAGEIPQFITLRLAGALPPGLLKQWKSELEYFAEHEGKIELHRRIENHLDRGGGDSWLKNPVVAAAVQDYLLYLDGERFFLHSWVIMPNHVHVLFTPVEEAGVPGIIHSLKSFSAKKANRLLGRSGAFWQEDYFDRFIRAEQHYHTTVEYIEMNPVRAGLCASRGDWPFGSAAMSKGAGGTPAPPVKNG